MLGLAEALMNSGATQRAEPHLREALRLARQSGAARQLAAAALLSAAHLDFNAPDALFIGTGSKTVVTDPAAIRTYFEGALLTRKPRAAPISSLEILVLSDTAVVIAGLNTSTGVLDGNTFSNPGRVTFVIAKRGPEWKIVHFHRSAMPK